MGLMDEVASENDYPCEPRHIPGTNSEYSRVEAPQSSTSDDNDSFTTSAVFSCPNCGLVVDVRHRTCHSCHEVLALCELGGAREQELDSPRGSSDGTLMDTSHSGSSQLDMNAGYVVQVEHSIDTSGF